MFYKIVLNNYEEKKKLGGIIYHGCSRCSPSLSRFLAQFASPSATTSIAGKFHSYGKGSGGFYSEAMITRSNLAEQLREYQIRSKHDWSSFSFLSSTSNLPSSRVDVVIFVILELIILAFLVFSAVSLYFRHLQLALVLLCIAMLLLLCMKITKEVRSARKKKRRMLLPLSMGC